MAQRMHSNHFRTAVLCATLLAGAAAPALAAQPDLALGKRLQAMGYDVQADADGDYQVLFGLHGQGGERRQLTYVRSPVETFGSYRIREIWSPAYQAQGATLPAAVANRLLEDAQADILGGWVRQGGTAVFVVKLAADADDTALREALEAAARGADAMDAELNAGRDAF
ncbi:hypothetical protein [Xanthomonas theicola]|uniref:Uncharacterized protein n=1 Tax=Xanthomonas theicola TaxID=56464 RepID=A0A2S6ZMB6_9XANT|nr:hypothetical protein [Xanthomonas theicola]PPT93319.1 hypothetical protein XthCFBP4691_00110 [Xanthomonas theicola]QNH24527.1 hypothetical protein G4Q83_06865 [Xanthomonas theicola]